MYCHKIKHKIEFLDLPMVTVNTGYAPCFLSIVIVTLLYGLFLILITPCAHASGNISTFAGNGSYVTDGIQATVAWIPTPTGTAVDTAGNLYIADSNNNLIRKVDTSGIISTVAGNGTHGFSGDGGLAVHAELANPTGVVADAAGDLYIVDQDNSRIRKVDASGVIVTVAGNGVQGFGGDGTQATNAELNNPTSIAFDAAGNFYIADSMNNRIRKVDTSGIISTVAGSGINGFSGYDGTAINSELSAPAGVTVDAAGNLYIADTFNNVIRKVDVSGVMSTVAGNRNTGYFGDGGPAVNAELANPFSVTLDAAGNLYIADRYNSRIRKIDTSGIISTVAGTGINSFSGDGGVAVSAELYHPTGVTFDAAGNLYIADYSNSRIRKVDTSGVITTVAGGGTQGFSGDGGLAFSTELNRPAGVAIDATGNLYIADSFNHRIRKVDTAGIISTVAGNGSYGFSGDGGLAVNAELNGPLGITVDATGNLYFADSNNNRIRKVDTSGYISTVAGNGTSGFSGDGVKATNAELSNPTAVSVDAAGNLYIADSGNSRIRKVDVSGLISTVAGNGTSGFSGDGALAINAELSYPAGVVVDASGNLYFADSNNNRIRKVDASGVITTVAGNGTLRFDGDCRAATNAGLDAPTGIAIDTTGNLYIADRFNNRVRKVDSSGIIFTVAGNGVQGFRGDGGPATYAEINNPSRITVDAFRDLYISDTLNNRIRRVTNSSAPIDTCAIAGDGQVTLRWTAASGAYSYNIYQGSISGGESTTAVKTGITGTKETITELMNGTTYYFTVAAVTAGGAVMQSNEVSATPKSSGGGGGVANPLILAILMLYIGAGSMRIKKESAFQ